MSLYSPSLAELTLRLTQVPSVTRQEEELCRQCLDWITQSFPYATMERARHNFWVAPRPLDSALPTVALVGHLDTVPQARQQRYEIDGDCVYGLGACDMKGGLAVMMHLLQSTQPTWCNVIGIFYDREEGPFSDNGLDLLLQSLPRIDQAVVLEPTSNQIQAGCVGSMHATLTFRGRRAHSARPWQGDNAYYKMLPALAFLSGLERKEVVVGGLPFYEVMSATQIVTENPANAIPEQVTVNVNYRFAPGKSKEQAWSDMEAAFASWAQLELREYAPAGDVSIEHPALQSWISRHNLTVEAKQAWTDVARLTAAGIPAFNFGPGDPAQAHQADEFVSTRALEQCYSLLHHFLSAK